MKRAAEEVVTSCRIVCTIPSSNAYNFSRSEENVVIDSHRKKSVFKAKILRIDHSSSGSGSTEGEAHLYFNNSMCYKLECWGWEGEFSTDGAQNQH